MITALFFAALSLLLPRPGSGQVAAGDAPDLTASDLTGQPIVLSDDAVILLDFWATWCPPCAESLPHYAQLVERHADAGLVVLAVNIDDRSRDVERFLGRLPADYASALTIAWDADQSLVRGFAPTAMPSAYLLDRNGVVREVFPGYDDTTAAMIESAVMSLLAEQPAAEEAP